MVLSVMFYGVVFIFVHNCYTLIFFSSAELAG